MNYESKGCRCEPVDEEYTSTDELGKVYVAKAANAITALADAMGWQDEMNGIEHDPEIRAAVHLEAARKAITPLLGGYYVPESSSMSDRLPQ